MIYLYESSNHSCSSFNPNVYETQRVDTFTNQYIHNTYIIDTLNFPSDERMKKEHNE